MAIDWTPRAVVDLVDRLKGVVNGHYTELECALCDVGDLMLVDEYSSFKRSESVWAVMDKKKRDNLFKRFLLKVKPSDPRSSLTTDGLRAFPAPGHSSGKKPSQKSGKRANRTTTTKKAKKKLLLD